MQAKPVDPTQADKIKPAKVDSPEQIKKTEQTKKTEQVKKQEQATQPAKVDSKPEQIQKTEEVLANETKQLNQAKLDKLVKKTGQFHSIGRRKDALARVYIQTGNGEFFVNKREINKYFTLPSFAKTALMPLELVKFKTKMNVKVFVKGGGISGQAGAVKLGLSRALSKFNPEWRVKFRSEGFLTRDSRVVERKKYGQKGARAKFQYSKR